VLTTHVSEQNVSLSSGLAASISAAETPLDAGVSINLGAVIFDTVGSNAGSSLAEFAGGGMTI
jgi:hypothetical protein